MVVLKANVKLNKDSVRQRKNVLVKKMIYIPIGLPDFAKTWSYTVSNIDQMG